MARKKKPKDEQEPEWLDDTPAENEVTDSPDAADAAALDADEIFNAHMEETAAVAKHLGLEVIGADAAKKPSAPPPDPNAPSPIPLKVFIKIAGPKWDQMAGFLSYAKLRNMGPRTVPEWRASYQAFMQKPVK